MKLRFQYLCAAGAVLLGFCALALAGKAAKRDVVKPPESMKWEAGPFPGIKMAVLWGDIKKGGPYGAIMKFGAGQMHPLHTHTHDLNIVVLSGTFIHKPRGKAEMRLGPGSYLLKAAGLLHRSGCAAGAECRFFMTSEDKFDINLEFMTEFAAENE